MPASFQQVFFLICFVLFFCSFHGKLTRTQRLIYITMMAAIT